MSRNGIKGMVLAGLMTIPAAGVLAGTIYVDGSFGGASDGSQANPYTSIQTAINNASTTMTETVEILGDGNTYDEDITVDRSVVLLGTGATAPVLTTTSSRRDLVQISAEDVTLDNLALEFVQRNGAGFWQNAIYAAEVSSPFGGAALGSFDNLTIQNCTFTLEPEVTNGSGDFIWTFGAKAISLTGSGGGNTQVLLRNNDITTRTVTGQVDIEPFGNQGESFLPPNEAMFGWGMELFNVQYIASENDVIAWFRDIQCQQVRDFLVEGNTLRGGGLEISNQFGNGYAMVRENDFDTSLVFENASGIPVQTTDQSIYIIGGGSTELLFNDTATTDIYTVGLGAFVGNSNEPLFISNEFGFNPVPAGFTPNSFQRFNPLVQTSIMLDRFSNNSSCCPDAPAIYATISGNTFNGGSTSQRAIYFGEETVPNNAPGSVANPPFDVSQMIVSYNTFGAGMIAAENAITDPTSVTITMDHNYYGDAGGPNQGSAAVTANAAGAGGFVFNSTLASAPDLAADSDNDLIADVVEMGAFGTDPNDADTDGDGLFDRLEMIFETDPLAATSFPDADGDSLPDTIQTIDNPGVDITVDPDTTSGDADGDQISDFYEYFFGARLTNPAFKPEIGDLNNDGIDASDGLLIFQSFLNLATLTPEQEERADVSLDGNVDNVDGVIIFNLVLGNIDSIPFAIFD